MTQRDIERRANLTRSGNATSTSDGSIPTRGSNETLDRVRRSETIADRVEFESVRRELPEGWDVRPDLVQFGADRSQRPSDFAGRWPILSWF